MTPHSSPHAAGTGGLDWSRRDFLKTGAAAVGAVLPLSANGATAASAGFGFLVISDTPFKAPEDAPETLVSEIDQVNQRLISLLNKLPGQPLPPEMGGGRVGKIKGMLHLGDMIDSDDAFMKSIIRSYPCIKNPCSF